MACFGSSTLAEYNMLDTAKIPITVTQGAILNLTAGFLTIQLLSRLAHNGRFEFDLKFGVYEREKSGVHTPAAQTSTATPEDDEMQVDDEVQVTDDATPDGLDAQLQRLREEQEKVEKLHVEMQKSLNEQEVRLDQEKKSQVERERLKTEERRQKLEKRQQELQANKESIGRSQEQRAHLAAQEAELDQRNGQILQEMIGEEVSDVEG